MHVLTVCLQFWNAEQLFSAILRLWWYVVTAKLFCASLQADGQDSQKGAHSGGRETKGEAIFFSPCLGTMKDEV